MAAGARRRIRLCRALPKGKESITGIDYEPWHYRYVGKEHAQRMNELNMCLEEYVAFLKGN